MTTTYATIAAMITRFGVQDLTEITDNEPPYTGQINEIKLQAAIDSANAEVDAYLAKQMSVPTVLQSPFVQMMACDIARYFLFDDAAPEHEVVRRYNQARATLDDIASGALQLACPWGGSPGELIAADAQSGSAEVFSEFAPRQITDDALRGF